MQKNKIFALKFITKNNKNNENNKNIYKFCFKFVRYVN